MELTDGEATYCRSIAEKDARTREFFARCSLPQPPEAQSWYLYLSTIKLIQGNLSNSLSFVATLLAKEFLMTRYGVSRFDAAAKAQGAAGLDIDVLTTSGDRIVGEVKTVSPYGAGDFGAAQKREFEKDIAKLQSVAANLRFLFVTEDRTFAILTGPKYASKVRGLRVVDLVLGRERAA